MLTYRSISEPGYSLTSARLCRSRDADGDAGETRSDISAGAGLVDEGRRKMRRSDEGWRAASLGTETFGL